ncbi:MAG: hypothetical protein U0V74_15100 [Chitinophagales bacterium]
MKNLSLLIIAAMVISLTACVKPKNKCSHEGLVHYTGPLAGDGCDWLININGVDYHPKSLSVSFQQDSMIMSMDYQLTGDTFLCGWGNKYPEIQFTCTYWPEY